MTDLTISDFPHTPPDGYTYEFEEVNRSLIGIWLRHQQVYDYNLGKSVRSIWGFYHPKRKEYYAPINSTKKGDVVPISQTRPYTAMQLKITPLEAAFV